MQLTGDRVREARRLRKLTQTELARRVGTSSSQISMMETNKSGTSLKTAMSQLPRRSESPWTTWQGGWTIHGPHGCCSVN